MSSNLDTAYLYRKRNDIDGVVRIPSSDAFLRLLQRAFAMLRDLDGRILRWGDGAAALYGFSAEQAVGRISHDLLQTRFPAPLADLEAALIADGQWHGELEHVTREGGTVLVASHWVLVDEGSDPPRVLEANRDISALAQGRLAQSCLASIVLSSDDPIISQTLDGLVTSWNPAAEAEFGWRADEMIGKPAPMIVADQAGPGEAGLIARVAADGRVLRVETTGVRRDGSRFPLFVTMSPMYDDSRTVIGVSSIMRNISQRRKDEAAWTIAVLDAAPNAMVLVGQDGLISMANLETARLFGYGRNELLGRPVEDLLPLDLRDGHQVMRADYLKAPSRRAMGVGRDLFGRRKDGEEVPIEIGLNPIPTPDGISVMAAIIDITDRKRAEVAMRDYNEKLEQRVAERTRELGLQSEARQAAELALAQAQKLEAVGQLTGGVAHDFNNLLTVITGNLDLAALDPRIGENTKQLLENCGRAAERGARLTGHLLAFARRQMLNPETVLLDDVVREFLVLVQRAVGEQVSLEFRTRAGLWPCEIDRAQFESALLNLAINARDAMPDGGVLSISIANEHIQDAQDLTAGRYVKVLVEDTGTGMCPELVARAVEPFFTTKDFGKGSGLGLSQVYGFVQQSGGAMRINSTPAIGTSIALYFPAVEAALTVSANVDLTGRARPAPWGSMLTVLLVEDDPDVLSLIETALRRQGHRVIAAQDGREALNRLDGHPEVGMMLADVMMPNGITGVQLAEEVRRRKPELPILLMSGYPRDELNRVSGIGTFPLMRKPFRPADLDALMHSMLIGAAPGPTVAPDG